MDAKNKWILEVENSLKGIQAAEGSPFLYTKIRARLEGLEKNNAPSKLVWLATASLLVLALLNITAIKSLHSQAGSGKPALQTLSEQLQLLNTNTINYN